MSSAGGRGDGAQPAAPTMARVAQPELVALLERELGAGKVVGPGDQRLSDYGRDECDDPRVRRPADCVVLAESRADVEVVLRLARERRFAVTPRGAGSGKVGGCVAAEGGVVLSTERMKRVVEVGGDDLVAVVEPGVVTGDMADAAGGAGLFYPPDPASLALLTVGGNIATNAGGPRAFKYGVTRDYVLGLEVVLMGGEVVRVGRRTSKGVTGYDLVGSFVGSEGTLGIVTEATMRLVPQPGAVVTALALFRDAATAGAAVGRLLRDRLRPCTMELLDGVVLGLLASAGHRVPPGAGAALLIELDGEPEGLEAGLSRTAALCEAAGAREVLVASAEAERRDLWAARRAVSPVLRGACRAKIGEDVCVPRGALGEALARIARLSAEVDLPIACFGHAGDGNLHVNMLLDGVLGPAGDPALSERVEKALWALFREVVALGGTLSGEHGIGLGKRRFLGLEQPAGLIEWQRRVKRMWDPDGLLNPGKIWPADHDRRWPE